MRPGRLPEHHRLEQQARDELRAKHGTKPDPNRERYTDPNIRRWGAGTNPQRWGADADPPVR